MRYRKLRIAWSVVCGAMCLLLICLWAQSRHAPTALYFSFGGRPVKVVSTSDRIYLSSSATGGGELQPYLANRDRTKLERDTWDSIRASESKLGFGFYQDLLLLNTSTLILPHWFPFLLFAAATIVPWIRWSARFSLRTLLIAITLVAVGLGVAIAIMA